MLVSEALSAVAGTYVICWLVYRLPVAKTSKSKPETVKNFYA